MSYLQYRNKPVVRLRFVRIEYINILKVPPRKQESLNDVISSVWYIANKFGVDKQHAHHVEKLALSIFDLTWKYHRLVERDRLFLQVAAILHAIGYYVNFSDHHIHAYSMIKTQNIMGFSDR